MKTVWIQHGSVNGEPHLFHVEIGSSEHERLLANGGFPVDPPEGEDVPHVGDEQPAAAVPQPANDPGEKPEDLNALKREVLDQRAKGAGVADPEKLPNKAAVVAAIREAEGQPAETAGHPEDHTRAQTGDIEPQPETA